ncbi:unnamed protein product [Adineta steineri]|uniref:riboflavin kinase n=1 Tax=Adineta steineri TaxID=433720 RepID=A0A814UFH7_9BILA|nr:unnamed protein product [Adineta steineri]CAF3935451.1 unnamed protein product [Adineta steineri]
MLKSPFPYFTLGTIVRGFGRGSKDLGCPTANLDETTIENLPTSIDEGVYYGWAQLLTKTNHEIYKIVTSIGTNPFYNNEKKTIETHIMNEFANDFYGEQLKIVLLGKIRPMKTFQNLNDLTSAIQQDITTANCELNSNRCRQYLNHSFFKK